MRHAGEQYTFFELSGGCHVSNGTCGLEEHFRSDLAGARDDNTETQTLMIQWLITIGCKKGQQRKGTYREAVRVVALVGTSDLAVWQLYVLEGTSGRKDSATVSPLESLLGSALCVAVRVAEREDDGALLVLCHSADSLFGKDTLDTSQAKDDGRFDFLYDLLE